MITAQLTNLRKVDVDTRDGEDGRDLGPRAAVTFHAQSGGTVRVVLSGADQSAALLIAAQRAHDFLREGVPAKGGGS